MANENDDVKSTEESSPLDQQQQDDKQQDDSSTSEKSSTQATGLDKVIADAVKASRTQIEGEKKTDEKSTQEDEDDGETEDTSEKEVEKKEEGEEKQEEDKKDDKGPVPYERFNEVNTAKNVAEQQLNDVKPLAESYLSIHNHCQQHNISTEEFRYWMNVAALSKSDPAKALEVLKPQLQQFQSFTGDALPDDLRLAVESGEMKLEHAKRLAAAENRMKFGQQQQQVTMRQVQQQQEQQLAQTFQNALGTWINTKKGTDPDFVPKANDEAPDGKYELFLQKLDVEARRSNIRDAAGLVALAEKVHSSVNATVKRFSPKPSNGSKTIRSTQARSTVAGPPKTLEEAVSAGAAKAGIAFTPNRK